MKNKQFTEALAWCKENKMGACACLNANPHLNAAKKKGGLLTGNPLDQRLKDKIVTGKEHATKTILTDDEERNLVYWCVERKVLFADKKKLVKTGGKVRDIIGGQVRGIILQRIYMNRKRGCLPIPLSPAAQAIATGGGFPTQNWFMRFFTFHKGLLRRLLWLD